jgi:hypothetical protein
MMEVTLDRGGREKVTLSFALLDIMRLFTEMKKAAVPFSKISHQEGHFFYLSHNA